MPARPITRVVLAAALVALLWVGMHGASVGAQATSCAQVPPAPRNLSVRLEEADRGRTRAEASTPAVAFFGWRAQEGGAADTTAERHLVEIGSAPGTADVARVDTESAATSYVSPSPNGTFYVRVRATNRCGSSLPSNEVRLDVRGSVAPGLPNPAVIVDAANGVREGVGATAFLHVTGQVRNGWGAAPAVFAEVMAVFEGPSGDLPRPATAFVNGASRRLTRSGLVTDTVLDASASGCFTLYAEVPTNQATPGVRLSVSSRAFGTERLAGDLVVRPGAPRADDFGDLVLPALVMNRGPQSASFSQLWTQVLDADGRVVGCRGVPVVPGDGGELGRLVAGVPGSAETPTEVEAGRARSVAQWTTWEDETVPATTDVSGYASRKQRVVELLRNHEASLREVSEARDLLRREARAIEDRLAAR